MIEAKELVKKYGNFTAADNLSLTLDRSECVVLLGSNGSGKSTLIKMLAMVIKPTSGEITVDNQKGKKARTRIAYCPQDIVLFEELTVKENLFAWSSLKGKESVQRADYLISELDMNSFVKKRVDRLSGGQSSRVNLAVALMGKYDYILLDEPLAGIDEYGAECISSLLKKEKDNGCGLLLTEHNPKVLLPLTDRVLKLDGGHFTD